MTHHANAVAVVDGVRRYVFAILDHEKYGKPGIHTVITQDGYHHEVPRAQIEQLADKVVLPSTKPTLAYHVFEPYEVIRTWETASNYTRYEILPGEYPIKWVTINHGPVPAGESPYYGQVVLDAIEQHRHYVNRVFTASSVHDEYPDTRTTHTLSTYAYDWKPGDVVAKGNGRIVEVEPAQGEVFPAQAVAAV